MEKRSISGKRSQPAAETEAGLPPETTQASGLSEDEKAALKQLFDAALRGCGIGALDAVGHFVTKFGISH